jgi:signal transduction histidine kinase
MAAASIRFVPRRWLELSARSARLRLTLMYSGMFLLLGTAVVAIIFVVVWTGTGVGSSATGMAVSPRAPGTPALHAVATQQHSADVARLLAVSWLTLVLTAGASALLGWFAAGRVLRPLRNMTATARTISAGNLHERLEVSGPEDEFKQLGDTFDDLLGRLEASFGAQRRFVANAAHELRTPLTVERAVLQVALADPHANAETLRATCEEVLASGRSHERLLDALLTLASGERGLERREPVDLAPLAGDAARAAQANAAQHGLEVITELAAAPVLGDPALLKRLVANLIDNALGYNWPDGQVAVSTTTRLDQAVLTVANTGPAVPPEEVKRLFEPFQRLDRARTGSDGHHGLGLSIVRAIAVAHNATVTAQPGPEGGLVVIVSFEADPGGDGRT